MQVLFLGGLGGVMAYGIARALQKRGETGEEGSADRDGVRNADPRGRSVGPGFQTEVLARIETLERAFQEQNEEITARFNRLAARSRRRDPAGEPGPDDAPAQGLTRKQELRSKVASAKQRTLPLSVQSVLERR